MCWGWDLVIALWAIEYSRVWVLRLHLVCSIFKGYESLIDTKFPISLVGELVLEVNYFGWCFCNDVLWWFLGLSKVDLIQWLCPFTSKGNPFKEVEELSCGPIMLPRHRGRSRRVRGARAQLGK